MVSEDRKFRACQSLGLPRTSQHCPSSLDIDLPVSLNEIRVPPLHGAPPFESRIDLPVERAMELILDGALVAKGAHRWTFKRCGALRASSSIIHEAPAENQEAGEGLEAAEKQEDRRAEKQEEIAGFTAEPENQADVW